MAILKRTLALFLISALAVSAWAERVSQDDAATVANNFMNAGISQSGAKKTPAKRMVLKKAAQAEESQFYVYENADGEGWVMVAANDIARPILAYSDEGHFRTDNQPDNIKSWLGGYNKQIKNAEINQLEASEEIKAEWQTLRKGERRAKQAVVVSPMLTTLWDQDNPYWKYCPKKSGENTLTGCVATAMAQVMNYWEWPVTGSGTASTTCEGTTYTVNFANTTYDWDNMNNRYALYYNEGDQYYTSTSLGTTAQQDAVATLMYHCGVAVQMSYRTNDEGGSGAQTVRFNSNNESYRCAQNALWKNFGYNKSKIKGYYRNGGSGYSSWTRANWIAMLKEELDAARPIMYAGGDSQNQYGHSFVCDGYDSSNKFHFNWGWSGYCNGYYDVDALDPGPGGSGSGDAGDYSYYQDVIIGIEPPEVGHTIKLNGTGCTLSSDKQRVENGNSVTITITPTDATYDYTSTTVTLGGATISSSNYTLNPGKTTLTINGSAITGESSNDLTITVVWTKNRYKYELLGENCTVPDDGMVAKNASLNLTIAPDAGFTLANAECWDVTMGGSALTYGTDFTYNSSTGAFAISPVTGDVEILAYGLRPVTWMANGSAHAANVAVDGKITLPADPEDCSESKKFVGWCTTSDYSHATTAPTFAKAGDTYSVATYYAVYATPAPSSAPKRAKKADPTEGTYKIYADISGTKYYAAGGTSGKLTNTTNAADAAIYTFETVEGGGIAIKSGDDYLGYGTSGTDFTTKNTQYAWVFSAGSHGTWRATSKSTTNRAIVYRAGSTNKFAPYAVSNINGTEYFDIELELVGGGSGSYTDYTTVCETCTLSSIALNTTGVKTTFVTNETFTSEGLVVTANYSNCSSKAVIPNSVSTPDMSSAGDKTVTVSYTEGGETKTNIYQITIVAPYTVTYMACGDVFTTQEYAPGAALVLPTENPGANDGMTFAGWITSPSYTNKTTAPTYVTSGDAVNANVTYYAVFH